MDALDLLIADHNRVRGLFTRFQDAEEEERTEEMRDLAATIRDELSVHTTIEEEIFYPEVRSVSEDVADLVDEGLQEHHVAKVLLEEIQGLDADDDAFVAKVKVLIENVEHHADEEEEDLFPKVRSNTSAEAREDLGQRLDARKGELGAPTLADRDGLTKTELDELAKEQEIPGRSTMDKDELAATVDPS
jgi:hemerythrin superfamily protein